jgi:uncharacterized cupredoxin-like copper-binding protein
MATTESPNRGGRVRHRPLRNPSIAVAVVIAVMAFAGSALAAGIAAKPSIISFSPLSAKPLAMVTISGKNFTGTKTVRIDGLVAKFKLVSPTKLTATVPSKAKSGKIVVTTAAGSVTSRTTLKVVVAAKPVATTDNVVAGKPSEFGFTLSLKTVKVGTVTFKLTNKGALPHDLKLCSSPTGGTADSCTGTSTPVISPGGSATLTVKFAKAGTYEYLCTVPGHAAAGMKGDLKVT